MTKTTFAGWLVATIAVGLIARPSTYLARAAESHQATSEETPSGPAAEVLAFEREIEAAVVRGDVAFVDAASASGVARGNTFRIVP